MTGWKFWIDRGGTFTDIVARHPDGRLHNHKLLSENPEQYPDAAIAGIRQILGLDRAAPVPATEVDSVRMGTTVATNALLERKGEPTLLAITEGFADALRIGNQNRPHIFALDIDLPQALYADVIEIPERIAADGSIIRVLDEDACRSMLREAQSRGLRSVAVVLMHGYRYPEHELAVARIADECGFSQITLSSACSPLPRLVPRGDTTVTDAYLSPVLHHYVEQVSRELPGIPLLFMQSNGGLAHAGAFHGKDAVLSGPAGGVVGGIETARRAGFENLIGFDMGGTSTDVWHYAGEYEHQSLQEVGGIRLRTPMLRIHTVAAGGGSVLHYADGRFQVGPDSSGANPGPACYRRNGPLSVTDCNVLLGKLQPDHFPAVFGHTADQPLDLTAVKKKFTELTARINDRNEDYSPHQVAEGFLTIAIENMTQAIRKISIQRGYDISRYTLCVFGGAGGQHACLVADALGMSTIYCHPLAGVLSAYGIGLAATSATRERAIEKTLEENTGRLLEEALTDLACEATNALVAQGEDRHECTASGRLFLRYAGTDTPLELPYTSNMDDLYESFTGSHRKQFGYDDPANRIIVDSIRVTVSAGMRNEDDHVDRHDLETPSIMETEFFSMGSVHNALLYRREELPAGFDIKGPAIITEATGTLIVEPGWQARVNDDLAIVMKKTFDATEPANSTDMDQADPVLLEIFNRRFMSIAEQMGLVLERTSHSVNIKERMDFSCALFTATGDLVANAPHIPVHLGSMSDSVRAVIEKYADDIHAGDSFVLNNPYAGGTHLPDITIVTPVYDEDNTTLLFFVASRGHHADIGGISPGSMPAESRSITEEGILLDNLRIVRDYQLDEQLLRKVLGSGDYPARKIGQNIADLRAQLAANHQGISEVHKLVREFGREVVTRYTNFALDNAEAMVRDVIGTLTDGEHECTMDNGAHIHVSARIDKAGLATIDFTGSSDQLDSNFNAPASVCRAAVLYVFRCLVDKDIPLNEGCLRPLKVIIPEHSCINPEYPAAVVAGNVETSQVIVDCLFAALGKLAASQGTMNNFTFGTDDFQYYETIAGGTGAGPGFDGASAVQSHMTNSRLTDPEIIEQRYPVRVEYFRVRRDAGGPGKFRGGSGVERCLHFEVPVQVSILANRRTTAPFGLDGGEAGSNGENWYINPAGKKQKLPSSVTVDIPANSRILIKTPGGGGFGKA